MTDARDFLSSNPEYIGPVSDIVEYVEENKKPDNVHIEDTNYESCFTHTDVPHGPQKLYQLERNGFLERVFDSNSSTVYALRQKDSVASAVRDAEQLMKGGAQEVMHDFPDKEEHLDGVFDDVVGYEKVKWLMKRAITTQDITNILLVGPPGSAKTVFLMCINSMEGSVFMSGKPSSGPGVLDKMFEEKPRFMLIDEMDDMPGETQEVLSQYTETGILDETKSGKDRKLKTNTKTFGSANHKDQIQGHILDRFLVLEFDPYTKEEFIEVCEHILPKKEKQTVQEAGDIARAIWDMEDEANVRKAIQVSRLSRGDPKKVLDVLDEYTNREVGGLQSWTPST